MTMSKELEEFEKIIEKTDSLNNTCVHLPKCLKDNKCRYNIDNLMCPDYEMANNIKQTLLKAQENKKVLEIIKKKRVNVDELLDCIRLCNTDNEALEEYNHKVSLIWNDPNDYLLTEEEFDLLKRWIE